MVTPPGEVPIAPEGDAASADCCALPDGVEAEEGALGPPPEEHAVSTAATPATHAAEPNRERHGYRRMMSIYATLAAMMERTRCQECCRY